jgi:FtsH-binding integral membrane protein
MPAYPTGQGPYAAPVPGKGLAIAGLILAFVIPLVGFILSLVARVKLKNANAPTGIAVAGIIIGLVFTVLGIIGVVVGGIALANVLSMCAQLGPGTWQVGGATYTCG